ncbi:MAG: hypothetical protein KatS3mg068_2370 [Candidatus Sericytochromatia bacterium]|nr:MAG: hypothetical protein KatS3mg068_2370 [Candidatus Sericytochromatia bacterium]
MKNKFLIPIFLTFLLNYSCYSINSEKNNDEINSQQVENNKVELDVNEVFNLLNDKNYQFIDVREEYEYREGHIKGTKLIPLGTIESSLNFLDKNINYVMICRSGSRSMKALKILKSNGFNNVFSMKGGMLEWAKNNLPIER